jgi:hypothetical protein
MSGISPSLRGVIPDQAVLVANPTIPFPKDFTTLTGPRVNIAGRELHSGLFINPAAFAFNFIHLVPPSTEQRLQTARAESMA